MDKLAPIPEKPWPLFGYAPGMYSCKCLTCSSHFEGDKRAITCLLCAASQANSALAERRRSAAVTPTAMDVTPKMIAAAWATWHSRHGGKLGPGPAFVEAITAALAAAAVTPGIPDWRPIETAPKDEEFIGRCGPGYKGFSCFWDGDAFVHYDPDEGQIYYPVKEWRPFPPAAPSLSGAGKGE